MVAWAAAAALLVVAGVRMLGPSLGGTAEPPLVTIDGDRAGGSGRDGGGGAPGGGTGLYVHVAGAVRRPGLYRVPDDSRVAAAVAKAGGPLRRAEMTAVNLAQPLEDGQQVIVPAAVAGGAPVSGAAAPGDAAGEVPISLATATQEQLEELDGIGPVLAAAIIEYR